MPASASSSPPLPDPLQAFASQQSDQPTVDSTKDPTAPLSIPALPDLPLSPASPAPDAIADRQQERAAAEPTAASSVQLTVEAGRAREKTAASARAEPPLPAEASGPSGSQPAPPSTPASRASDPSLQSAPASPSATSPLPSLSPTSASSANAAAGSAAAFSSVPSFLRPAELSLWSRVKLHPLFGHWPNIGYLISAVSVLVSDILWLRTLMIVANCFGILVNRSFRFWTGVRWNVFFILANLLQIAMILHDSRSVQLSAEEQTLYDNAFADVFSKQEFNKLLKVSRHSAAAAHKERRLRGG